ncbi:MAG TPA: 1,4-alpha-glucan branching protein domain-containing protein [Rectinemataceae bacterium]|nr:1,4-alpha-glucan branching protein domain-containing protein [Rectinemataceae bacterium]
MANGQLALVLNAHLPFVRHPEYPRFLEERWFFEALSETYLPLLRLFRRLEADSIPFKLTLTISPTLASMLGDKLLGDRYLLYLEMQSRLAAAEEQRLSGDPTFQPVLRLYSELYRQDREDFETLYGRDILGAFDYLYKKGRIELITSGASHAFLPMFVDCPEAVSAQIETAIVAHRRLFGKHPTGFWLPQLGWHPGLADALRSYNLLYTIITTRSALLGDPTPHRGSFAPVQCPNGLTVFIRDAEATKAVWSESEGYPADSAYRDFYRDIGFDLPIDYLSPYLEEEHARIFTGFKYWSVTGPTEAKSPYDPERAARRAREHAAHFLAARAASAGLASRWMDRPPLMVCPYDAELFGHWWFEGPLWLEALFRQAEGGPLDIVTLGEYLRQFPENQVSMPEFSSWGDGGYAEVWLDGSNDWIYRHLFKAIERMTELAERFPDESGLRERILNQAAREVILAMCSDWALIMRAGKAHAFARRQVEDAIGNFGKIYDMLCSNTVGTEWLTRLEKRNNIFPDVNYRIFRKKR